MLNGIHKKYQKGELGLADYLAAHRTVLANDRTLLSYIRTALTFFIAGATFIRFFEWKTLSILGWLFIPISIIILLAGVLNHRKRKKMIYELEKKSFGK